MNIRDLKYLIALVEHQHFGKAAEACFVSQPALSMQIQKLEEILGIKLLERINKSILFTAEGLTIAERAQNILIQVDEMYEIAKLAKDPYNSELKIGIFPTLSPYLLPLIISKLSKKFSKLSFCLLEEQTTQLIDKLKVGKIDAAFLAYPSEKRFQTIPLFEEEFVLAVPNNHILAKKKMIKQMDLTDKELILLDEGHCMRDLVLTLCQNVKARERHDFRATSLETLRHMISNGIGMTLIPKLACTTYKNKNIVFVPFKSPKPKRSICLAWRKTSPKQYLLDHVANYIKTILSTKNDVAIINKN